MPGKSSIRRAGHRRRPCAPRIRRHRRRPAEHASSWRSATASRRRLSRRSPPTSWRTRSSGTTPSPASRWRRNGGRANRRHHLPRHPRRRRRGACRCLGRHAQGPCPCGADADLKEASMRSSSRAAVLLRRLRSAGAGITRVSRAVAGLRRSMRRAPAPGVLGICSGFRITGCEAEQLRRAR